MVGRCTHRPFSLLAVMGALRATALSLPSSRSAASVVQARLMTTFHRTGTALTSQAVKCLAGANVTVDHASHGVDMDTMDKYSKITMLVRNPFVTIASRYIYHRDTGEKWTLSPGTALHLLNVSSRCLHETHMEPDRDESYTHFLRRLPWQLGVLNELCVFRAHAYNQMKIAKTACHLQKHKCTSFCIERFMGGSGQYRQAWLRLWRALDLDPLTANPDFDCFQRSDLTNPSFVGHQEHVTMNKLVGKDISREDLVEYLRYADPSTIGPSIASLERIMGCS